MREHSFPCIGAARPSLPRWRLSSTRLRPVPKNLRVRICVIFNPTARGEKSRHFRRHLDMIGAECALKQTAAAGGARPLAAEAIREGFDIVVAAGGDGTLNEVLNGIGDVPDGFERIGLGVLPLGTVNVFAKEIGLPMRLQQAWDVLRQGREARIDLPGVSYAGKNAVERRYFAQLAGAGLDARAIELVDWELKKRLGPFAYIWAGFVAMRGPASQITAANGKESATGELVLVGNGRFYGGRYRLFPHADLRDGLLEVCVFPRASVGTILRCLPMFVAGQALPSGVAKCFQTDTFTLSSPTQTPVEVDGESIGHLPATFSMERGRLRVIVP
jgi:diacylglycerol kinase (ATP)